MEEMIVIEGALAFDSWIHDTPQLRTHDREARHLIYEGAGIILDLLIKDAEKGHVLYVGGQVLPGEPAGRAVSDLQVSLEHGSEQAHTHTNTFGEFAFHGIPNDRFDLSIKLNDRRFTVRGLSNTEPRGWRIVPSVALGAD